MTELEEAALKAYAAPIQEHARDWALSVLVSIELDVKAGESVSVVEDAKQVKPLEEFIASASSRKRIPEGARRWAKQQWCQAFKAELKRLVDERTARIRAAGDRFMREHLRATGSR